MTQPVSHFLKKLIPEEHTWKLKLFQQWETIMGPLKDKVSIARIEQSTLILQATHPSWAHEFHLLSTMLKQKINTTIGSPKITHLKFVTQETKQINPQKNNKRRAQIRPTVLSYEPTAYEKFIIHRIQDTELQKNITLYLARCKQIKEHS